MSEHDEEKEFMILAVKLLFKKIEEGSVVFHEDQVPGFAECLRKVQFDSEDDPIYETITGLVRAAANMIVNLELEKDRKQRKEIEETSPVHQYLTEIVPVTDEEIKKCVEAGSFMPLAFELFKEAGSILVIVSNAYLSYYDKPPVMSRNQAILAGMITRIYKLMISILQLTVPDERGEVIMILQRCILETVINILFLIHHNDEELFDSFVKLSLAPERELYNIIMKRIDARDGASLPIEERMLSTIERLCKNSDLSIEEVSPKYKQWGGSFPDKLEALNMKEAYVALQRIPSHTVHGSWADLLMHHIEPVEGGFRPNTEWRRVDERMYTSTSLLALDAAYEYLSHIFQETPEVMPLYKRIDDLQERIRRVDTAHEQWLSRENDD